MSKVDPTPAKEEFKDIPVEINRDIDILFVIDDSGSMDEEQDSLTTNFQRFIEVLQNIEGGLPNVHIGVISSNVGAGGYNIQDCRGDGDNGALRYAPTLASPPGCTGPQGTFIKDVAGENGARIINYEEGKLADTFKCIATLGTKGCGFEQHLESMYRALSGSNPTNQGFLRQNAFLAVIFIADEDDCSTENGMMFNTDEKLFPTLGPLSSFRCFEFGVKCEPDDPRTPGERQDCVPRNDSEYMYPVDRYIQFLKNLKDDPNQLIVAGILGDKSPVGVAIDTDNNRPEVLPSCVSASGEAAPAIRLRAFLDAFPQRNTVTTICNDNLEDALVLIAELLKKVIGNPCLEGNIDLDPNTPGVQYECQVSDVVYPNSDRQTETVLPECTGDGAVPCWRLEADADKCVETDHNLSLVVERGSGNVAVGTHVQARCVVK